jgi:restriction endonuclease S subunit
MKNVTSAGAVKWQECIETELEGKRQPDFLKQGDILFAARGRRNYAALIDEGIEDRNAVASPHFYVIHIKDKVVLPEFLVWLLSYGPCQRYFEQSAEGTLTKSIRRSVLEATPIKVPDIQKQKALIEMARSVAKEKQILKQLTTNGEAMLNGLANDLF